MEMVILMNQVNKFKDFTDILINNLFSGSSLNNSSNSGLRGGHHGEGSVTQAWWAEGGQAL